VARVLILLPPSEGKTAPARGRPLDLERLSFPRLDGQRRAVLDELGALCGGDPEKAASVLGLGPTQYAEVARNSTLREAPTAPAAKVYTGVLYSALDHASLRGAALRRVNRWAAVQSALFGLVRLGDPVPAYRLSGDVALPGLGRMSTAWRPLMEPVVAEAAGSGLVLDLRSSVYTGFWRPDRRTVSVRVLQDAGGRLRVVSHSNKATKGRIVRALAADGSTPSDAGGLAEHLTALGWHAEVTGPRRVDVVVTDL
jgi:cytoplasmic iron level regulating protein YaaA (DUF328/UPF0246 family)